MKFTTTLIFFLLCLQVSSQEEINVKNVFKGTRFINGQSANLIEKGKLHMQIQHRFGDISQGFYELFGLDQASMRFGFEYGFGNNFNLGFGRSTYLKAYDLSAKFKVSDQNSGFPVSMVLSTGGSIPTIKNYYPENYNDFSNKVSGNIQLHLARSFEKIGLQVSPGYLKTGYQPDIDENLSIFTLGVAGSVKISRKVSANIEYLHPFSDELNGNAPFSIGVDLDTGGHLFQLMVSNVQHMYEQAIFTNTSGDWTEGKLYLGFNLIREFTIKYY